MVVSFYVISNMLSKGNTHWFYGELFKKFFYLLNLNYLYMYVRIYMFIYSYVI